MNKRRINRKTFHTRVNINKKESHECGRIGVAKPMMSSRCPTSSAPPCYPTKTQVPHHNPTKVTHNQQNSRTLE